MPSPEQMGSTSEHRPSADLRESAAKLRIIELQRQQAELLTQMAEIDASDHAQALRVSELQRQLEEIKLQLEKASSARDAAANEAELRRFGD